MLLSLVVKYTLRVPYLSIKSLVYNGDLGFRYKPYTETL
nr:MAG TPA: hypothetical protein [Caudoviricetes sp.]